MGEIISEIFEDELYYKEKVILKYKIQYPRLVRSMYRYGMRQFNEYNYMKALKLKEYCENQLFKEAKELFDLNIQHGYPLMMYEIIYNYCVTYRTESVISLYTDEYIFSGGAHGNTKREAQNWNLQNGKSIELKNLFSQNPYYIIDIFKEINLQIESQIKNGENQYFSNFCQLVQEHFKLENFYIVPNGIKIFFNQYEIAPYSSGIPEFFIPI